MGMIHSTDLNINIEIGENIANNTNIPNSPRTPSYIDINDDFIKEIQLNNDEIVTPKPDSPRSFVYGEQNDQDNIWWVSTEYDIDDNNDDDDDALYRDDAQSLGENDKNKENEENEENEQVPPLRI